MANTQKLYRVEPDGSLTDVTYQYVPLEEVEKIATTLEVVAISAVDMLEALVARGVTVPDDQRAMWEELRAAVKEFRK